MPFYDPNSDDKLFSKEFTKFSDISFRNYSKIKDILKSENYDTIKDSAHIKLQLSHNHQVANNIKIIN